MMFKEFPNTTTHAIHVSVRPQNYNFREGVHHRPSEESFAQQPTYHGSPSLVTTFVPVDGGVVRVRVEHGQDHVPELSQAAAGVIAHDLLHDRRQGNVTCTGHDPTNCPHKKTRRPGVEGLLSLIAANDNTDFF